MRLISYCISKRFKQYSTHFLMFFLLLILMPSTFALIKKSAKDDQRIETMISATELTRIFIRGDRIASVRGVEGAYSYLSDDQQGGIFLLPHYAYRNQPFSVYLTTESGHNYLLILTPQLQHADSIELIPQIRHLAYRQVDILTAIRQLKRQAMQLKLKFKRTRQRLLLRRTLSFKSQPFIGKIYQLTNTTGRTRFYTEGEFYHQGILAVSLDQTKIKQGQSTFLYQIIKRPDLFKKIKKKKR